jgi:hypothetical protein
MSSPDHARLFQGGIEVQKETVLALHNVDRLKDSRESETIWYIAGERIPIIISGKTETEGDYFTVKLDESMGEPMTLLITLKDDPKNWNSIKRFLERMGHYPLRTEQKKDERIVKV